MVSNVFEWLRAADLKPDDMMVATRTKAVQELEKRVRASNTFELLTSLLDTAVGGCERAGEQSPAFAALLECVRAQSPAFPEALAENGLHLRVVDCLAFRHLLTPGEDEPDDDELLAASLLVAGLRLRPKPQGQHLGSILESLDGVARSNLQNQSVGSRERRELDWEEFGVLEGASGEAEDFNKQLLSALRGLVQGLAQQRRSDREELDVLWWLYNRQSERLGRPLKELSAFLAATADRGDLRGRDRSVAAAVKAVDDSGGDDQELARPQGPRRPPDG